MHSNPTHFMMAAHYFDGCHLTLLAHHIVVGNPPDQLKCQGTGRGTPSCSAMLLPAIPTYKGAVDSSLG